MSAPTTTRPSLVCRLTRIRAAVTGSSAPGVLHHCATCADCRQYFAQAEQLETGLRRQATNVAATAPGTLESRIFNAVERSKRPEHPPQRTLSWAMAGLAAAAVVAVVVVRIQRPGPAETPAQVASVDDVLAVANELPKQWLTTLQPRATKLLNENPLQAEMASVSSDARSALDFLALNFLPSNGQAAPAAESRPQSGGSS